MGRGTPLPIPLPLDAFGVSISSPGQGDLRVGNPTAMALANPGSSAVSHRHSLRYIMLRNKMTSYRRCNDIATVATNYRAFKN